MYYSSHSQEVRYGRLAPRAEFDSDEDHGWYLKREIVRRHDADVKAEIRKARWQSIGMFTIFFVVLPTACVLLGAWAARH